MLPYTSRARSQDTRENFELARSCTYDLLSVVVHLGSMNTGKLNYLAMRSMLTQQVTTSPIRVSEIRYAQISSSEI